MLVFTAVWSNYPERKSLRLARGTFDEARDVTALLSKLRSYLIGHLGSEPCATHFNKIFERMVNANSGNDNGNVACRDFCRNLHVCCHLDQRSRRAGRKIASRFRRPLRVNVYLST